MSVELIAILAVGGALAGMILTATRGLRQDINDLRGRRVTGRALNAEDQVMVSGIVGQHT